MFKTICMSVYSMQYLGAGDDLGTVLKSSPAPRVNSVDCSLNRHEITVLLSYIHAHNHKSTEDDNVSIPYY